MNSTKANLLLLLLLHLLLLPLSLSIECGRPLTRSCLGETDIRYDPDASDNIKDQSTAAAKQEGFFTTKSTTSINVGGVFFTFPIDVFTNLTIRGSRSYFHRYAIGSQVVGVSEAYAVSSYERDGTFTTFSMKKNTTQQALTPNEAYTTVTVDNRTLFSAARLPEGSLNLELTVCLVEDCSQTRVVSERFRTEANGTIVLEATASGTFRRINESEFVQGINDSYNRNNFSAEMRVASPMQGTCLTGFCPTEEIWCRWDPECSTSPYQEPPGKVKPGVIAGFTVAGAVLLVACLYILHLHLVNQQKHRYRAAMAQRIVETIEIQRSMRSLTPELLATEFQKIDSETPDGRITKEELWEFVSSGKAGEMNEKDFNALFAAMDTDNSGYVDFLEFCSFLGQCHNEYTAARANLVASGGTSRRSMADTAARRLSNVAIAGEKVELPEDE